VLSFFFFSLHKWSLKMKFATLSQSVREALCLWKEAAQRPGHVLLSASPIWIPPLLSHCVSPGSSGSHPLVIENGRTEAFRCVLVFHCITNTWERSFKGSKDLLWLMIQRFQSKVSWLHCFGLKVKQTVMVVGACGRGFAPYGSQEGLGKDSSLGHHQ
jgi:hypothetical protein